MVTGRLIAQVDKHTLLQLLCMSDRGEQTSRYPPPKPIVEFWLCWPSPIWTAVAHHRGLTAADTTGAPAPPFHRRPDLAAADAITLSTKRTASNGERVSRLCRATADGSQHVACRRRTSRGCTPGRAFV